MVANQSASDLNRGLSSNFKECDVHGEVFSSKNSLQMGLALLSSKDSLWKGNALTLL